MVWFSFLIIRFAKNLENLSPCHHEAVGGFFGASQGRADTASFEGGNKSGASAQWPLDFDMRTRAPFIDTSVLECGDMSPLLKARTCPCTPRSGAFALAVELL